MKPPMRVESELAKNDEEALRLPETLREEPIDDEAVLMNPARVERPDALKVPDVETFPEPSILNNPDIFDVEVATLKEFAVRVLVVVPSVTWKM